MVFLDAMSIVALEEATTLLAMIACPAASSVNAHILDPLNIATYPLFLSVFEPHSNKPVDAAEVSPDTFRQVLIRLTLFVLNAISDKINLLDGTF